MEDSLDMIRATLDETVRDLSSEEFLGSALRWYTPQRLAIIDKVADRLEHAVQGLPINHRATVKLQELQASFQSIKTAYQHMMLDGIRDLDPHQLLNEAKEIQQMLRSDMTRRAVLLAAAAATTAAAATAPVKLATIPSPDPVAKNSINPIGYLISLGKFPTLQEAQQYAGTLSAEAAIVFDDKYSVVVKQHFDSRDSLYDWLIPMQRKRLIAPYEIISAQPGAPILYEAAPIEGMKKMSEMMKEATHDAYNVHITDALIRYPLGIPEEHELVEAVIWQESAGVSGAESPEELSDEKTYGLMQLTPHTFKLYHNGRAGATEHFASRFHERRGTFIFARNVTLEPHTCNIFSPIQNIDAGVHYLADLFKEYYKTPGDLIRVLRIYNAGPTATRKAVSPINEEYPLKVLGVIPKV